MPKTKDRVADVADSARPYVERAMHDQELRKHVKQAYEAAREIYDELIAPRDMASIAQRVSADHELQDTMRTAVAELRRAANRLQGERESHAARNLLLLTGVVAGLLYNPITGPSLRGWLKNTLFGGGDEFGFETGSNGAPTS